MYRRMQDLPNWPLTGFHRREADKEADKQAVGGRREAPIVVGDEHTEAGLSLPTIRTITKGAMLSAPMQTHNRPVLQFLPQS